MKCSVTVLCKKAGMTRQNFYKSRRVRQRQKVNEQLVKQLVKAERTMQPRLGGLKLHHMLRDRLKAEDVSLGRDRFFEVLKNQALLLKPLPKAPRTTNSSHSLPVFRNLIKDVELTGPNQVWVSDITYIRTGEDFAYLSLITDKYSRKVVGFHVGLTLETRDTLKALAMALESLPDGAHPIHHSDRGCQYCSHEYVNILKAHDIQVSMTEEDHCAENALAERVNGILKQEYFLNHTFKSVAQVRLAVKEAVWLYNTCRPHRSLKLCTPGQIHEKAA